MVKCRKFKGVRGFLDKVIKYDVSPLAPYIGQARIHFFYLPHFQTFSRKSLHLSEEKRIFAARKLNH